MTWNWMDAEISETFLDLEHVDGPRLPSSGKKVQDGDSCGQMMDFQWVSIPGINDVYVVNV